MRLGLSSYSYGWSVGVKGSLPPHPMSAAELLETARAFGVGVVQIADNLPLHELPDDELDALKALAERYGIRLELGMRGLIRENVLRYLSICRRLNTGLLRIVIDCGGFEPSVEEAEAFLSELLPALAEARVVLAVENHDRFPAALLAGIMRRLDSPWVRICLDTANSLGAGEGIRELLQELGPYIGNLHIKDFRIRRLPHLQGFLVEGAPAGTGQLDIPRLIASVGSEHESISAIFEQWCPPENSVEETVKKEQDWAAQSIRFLKQYLD